MHRGSSTATPTPHPLARVHCRHCCNSKNVPQLLAANRLQPLSESLLEGKGTHLLIFAWQYQVVAKEKAEESICGV